MCIAWQWPLWAIWVMTMPLLIHTGYWFGELGPGVGAAVYLAPPALWTLLAATLATRETRHTYPEPLTPRTFARRMSRVVPFVVLNTGMLPHQHSAFTEGLLGPMHSEFERTPKEATIGAPRAELHRTATPRCRSGVKIHWPYVLAEGFFVAYQLMWAVIFLRHGLAVCAAGALFLAACVLSVAAFYGDHDGKVCFVIPRRS